MYQVYGHAQCAYCKQAIQLLATQGKSFTYVDVRSPENADALAMIKAAGFAEVPQIYLNSDHIGGFTELKLNLQGA
jgi:glutaredoxin 3